MVTKNLKLYLLVLGGIALVLVAALGGGLFDQAEPWFLQWQHQAFAGLCHQMPERSYWISGQPIAVCSRCLGVYAGLFGGWLALPFLGFINKKQGLPVTKILLTAVIINLLDVAGNMLGFWENTLLSRLALGGWAGLTAAALFKDAFFTYQTKHKEEYYGRNTGISGAG